jgi:hypothetical protein
MLVGTDLAPYERTIRWQEPAQRSQPQERSPHWER